MGSVLVIANGEAPVQLPYRDGMTAGEAKMASGFNKQNATILVNGARVGEDHVLSPNDRLTLTQSFEAGI